MVWVRKKVRSSGLVVGKLGTAAWSGKGRSVPSSGLVVVNSPENTMPNLVVSSSVVLSRQMRK